MIYLLLILMTILCSIGAIFLKKASGTVGIKELVKNMNLYIGGILYLIAIILNIYVLRCLDYSTVLPLASITYIWTVLLSCFFLKEKINKEKIIGLIGIVIGAILIAK